MFRVWLWKPCSEKNDVLKHPHSDRGRVTFSPPLLYKFCMMMNGCHIWKQNLATSLREGRSRTVFICLKENNNETMRRWLEWMSVNTTYIYSNRGRVLMGKIPLIKGCSPSKCLWLVAPTCFMWRTDRTERLFLQLYSIK